VEFREGSVNLFGVLDEGEKVTEARPIR